MAVKMSLSQQHTKIVSEGRIVGYLDGVTDRAMIGWIADLEHPDRLEPVVCRGENGLERAFLPFVPRLDVCHAFGVTGRFGFAIPLHLLRGLGPTVSLHDMTGAQLNHATAVDVPQGVTQSPGACRVVLHIQKTAGTSLRNALGAAVAPGEALFLYPDKFIGLSPTELATLPTSQRASLRLVMGHFYFGKADKLLGPVEYVTFLREPEARLRSHYLHHVAERTLWPTGEGGLLDPATAVTEGATDEFDNLMVRMIGGISRYIVPLGCIDESHVRLALHNIRTRFRFVGIVERMDEDYPAMCRALQLQETPLRTENTCRVPDVVDQARRVDWATVMHRNRFDAMLYERVQAEGLTGRALANPARGRQMEVPYA